MKYSLSNKRKTNIRTNKPHEKKPRTNEPADKQAGSQTNGETKQVAYDAAKGDEKERRQ